MLSPEAIETAARLILRARAAQQPMSALPDACRPVSRADGYAVQLASLAALPGTAWGWKIAATSKAGQRHIGLDGPVAGRLLSDWVHAEDAPISLAGNAMSLAECEFAFRLARPLPPRAEPYTRNEVVAAIDTLHPAIEIPDCRFADVPGAGAAQLIADGACSREFVLGAATTAEWRSLDLAAQRVVATIWRDGRRVPGEYDGQGANALGHPLAAMVWIANELSAMKIGLAAGEVVTTGTCVEPVPVRPGDTLRVAFGPIGQVEARFAS